MYNIQQAVSRLDYAPKLKEYVLRYAVRDAAGWSAPGTVAAGDNWFINWADFPSVIAFSNHALAAHWLVKSGPGTYAYDVNLALSADGGQTWGRDRARQRPLDWVRLHTSSSIANSARHPGGTGVFKYYGRRAPAPTSLGAYSCWCGFAAAGGPCGASTIPARTVRR